MYIVNLDDSRGNDVVDMKGSVFQGRIVNGICDDQASTS